MLNVCVIGAGEHSVAFHLPALARYRAEHASLRLAAVCDIVPDRAERAAQTFGIERSFTQVETMLGAVKPDACFVLTPSAHTGTVVGQLLASQCPLVIEKPLGRSVAEARRMVEQIKAAGVQAMVSLNRRFDPMTTAARAWIGPRPLRLIRATMLRDQRLDPAFLSETGLHVIDVVRHVGGEVDQIASFAREVNGARWWTLDLTFRSGCHGLVEIRPTAGTNQERIEFFGDGFSAEARGAEYDQGYWFGWENSQLVRQGAIPPGTLPFVANGTYAETGAFFSTLSEGRPCIPTPADILDSMQLCELALAASCVDLARA